MNEIIKIEKLEIELSKDTLLNPEYIKKIQDGIENLKNNVYDFSTEAGIKEAKQLKTKANKFVKQLEEFCEPLEADGKKIASIRSSITTKLTSGKDAVIDKILAPVYEREDKIKSIKTKLFIASLNAGSNAEKLAEIESLNNYDWLAFKDEADKLIEQHKNFLLNEKIKFDEEIRIAKEQEEKVRQEREEKIREDAKQKALDEAKKAIKEELQKEAENKAKLEAKQKAEEEAKAKDIENKKKVHNEILDDLTNMDLDIEKAKEIVKAIALGKIRNLKIIY